MHELAKKIFQEFPGIRTDRYLQDTITEWLQKKAEELSAKYPHTANVNVNKQVLGLSEPVSSPSVEAETKCQHHHIVACKKCKPELFHAARQESWCWHIRRNEGGDKFLMYYGHSVGDDWKACPICAAPRPEPRPAKKTLAQILGEAWSKAESSGWDEEAKAAFVYFREIVESIDTDYNRMHAGKFKAALLAKMEEGV